MRVPRQPEKPFNLVGWIDGEAGKLLADRRRKLGVVARARRLAPTRDEIEEVLSVFGGPEEEGRGQKDRWFDGSFRQLWIVAVVQHERFGMQHVVADVGPRRKRFHHGLPRCLDTERCSALGVFHKTMRSGAVDATAS